MSPGPLSPLCCLLLQLPASSSDPHLLCGPRERLGTLSAEGWIVNSQVIAYTVAAT